MPRPPVPPRPVLPVAVALVLLNVGVQRLVWLVFLARFWPVDHVNAQAVTAFWEIWHGPGGWAGSLQRGFMVVNILLALYLWAELRALPRCSFAERSVQLLAYGGAGALLLYLQWALLRVSQIEPPFRLIRLPLTGLS